MILGLDFPMWKAGLWALALFVAGAQAVTLRELGRVSDRLAEQQAESQSLAEGLRDLRRVTADVRTHVRAGVDVCGTALQAHRSAEPSTSGGGQVGAPPSSLAEAEPSAVPEPAAAGPTEAFDTAAAVVEAASLDGRWRPADADQLGDLMLSLSPEERDRIMRSLAAATNEGMRIETDGRLL